MEISLRRRQGGKNATALRSAAWVLKSAVYVTLGLLEERMTNQVMWLFWHYSQTWVEMGGGGGGRPTSCLSLSVRPVFMCVLKEYLDDLRLDHIACRNGTVARGAGCKSNFVTK